MNDERVEVFFDGDCPLCMREIRMLQRLDGERGRIRFTDIAAPGFDASAYGMTQTEFMASIKGRNAEGEWIDGVDVFRELYSAVGAGSVVRLTRLPGFKQLLDVAYDVFAKNRLRLTGRGEACVDGVCEVPPERRAAARQTA